MRRYASALFAVFVAAACGGGPTGVNEGDPLELEEIQALFNALSEASAGAYDIPSQARRYDLPKMQVLTSSVPVEADLSATAPCEESGTISVDGSVDGDVDEETGEGDIDVKFTWTLNDCAVTAETTTFTTTGEIEFAGDFSFSEEAISISGTEKGGIEYTAEDGRSGSCAFDVSFEITASETSGSYEVTGEVCGVDVSELEPFEA